MLYEIRLLFGIEFRRYLRSRRFWRVVMTSTGFVAFFSLLLAVVLLIVPEQVQQAIRNFVYLFDLMWVFWSIVYLIAEAILVREVFSDAYRTRPLNDIYLVPFHPLAVVWGRLLVVWVQMGMLLLLGLPSMLFVAWLVGLAWGDFGLTVLWGWLATLGAGAILVFELGKWFPESHISGLIPVRTPGTGYTLLLLLVGGLVVLPIALRDQWLALPVAYLLMPAASYTAFSGSWATGGVGLLFLATVLALTTVGAAQKLGWWSERVFFWTRVMGTGAVWLWFTLHLYWLSGALVSNAFDAEELLHASMGIGTLLLLGLATPLLGYYAVGRLKAQERGHFSPIARGLLGEWVLIGVFVVLAWLAVGWGSGFWVPLEGWLSRAGYLLALLALAQSLYSATHLWNRYLYHESVRLPSAIFGVLYRLWLNAYSWRTAGGMWLLVWSWFIISAVLNSVLSCMGAAQAVQVLTRLHPLNGWLSLLQTPVWYGQYALYALGLSALAWGVGAWKVRRWLAQAEQGSEASKAGRE